MEFPATALWCGLPPTWLCKLSWTVAEVNSCFGQCQEKIVNTNVYNNWYLSMRAA
jgi:hypothetical protein